MSFTIENIRDNEDGRSVRNKLNNIISYVNESGQGATGTQAARIIIIIGLIQKVFLGNKIKNPYQKDRGVLCL